MADIDFRITGEGTVSQSLHVREISTFKEACAFVRSIPYGRNAMNNDILCVLKENRGTCSTKHALLRELANENAAEDVRLMIGIVRLSGENTSEVSEILSHHGLTHIPEAHCYLRWEAGIIDCTKDTFSPDGSGLEILTELEIHPGQIGEFKVKFHQDYLRAWINDTHSRYTLPEIWEVRERCIAALTG